MTGLETEEDFGRWVEPRLTLLARYAARQVGPTARDRVVEDALIRAWQRRTRYDETRGSAEAWLLGLVGQECRRPRRGPGPAAVVELVDESVARPPSSDVELEQGLDDLEPREQKLVDLRYFVGLDVATVAEVMPCEPRQAATLLFRVRTTLGLRTGDDDGRTDERLSALARQWQHEQPPPPEVPLDRLDTPLPRRPRPRAVVMAAGAAVLAGAGVLALLHPFGGDDPVPRASAATPAPQPPRPKEIVPWRDLRAGNPVFAHDANGAVVTPYDQVTATGTITGTVHPGDTLVFEAVLTSPGIVSLRPCPNYTIAFGEHTLTRRLNCTRVPYYASIVSPDGQVSKFQPVLPAGIGVFFRMAVIVPEDTGRQEVTWTLDGPTRTPAFSGVVDVTAGG